MVKIQEVIQLTTVFQALELIQKLQQVKPVLLKLKNKWNTRLRWEPTPKLWLNGVKLDMKLDQFQILELIQMLLPHKKTLSKLKLT